MGNLAHFILRLVVICSVFAAVPLQARTVVTLATGFVTPCGVAVDSQGNVFAISSATNEVKEILAVSGAIPPAPTIRVLGSGFSFPCGVDVDANGNVFVADTGHNQVKEMLAVGGAIPVSPTINVLASGFGFNLPGLLTLDGNGNIFVGDNVSHQLYEIPFAGGYSTVNTVGSGFTAPGGVAIDANGNVFVADGISGGGIYEIEAVGGSIPASPVIRALATGFSYPSDVKVDAYGNVYVADTENNAVKEILAVGGTIPASPTIITLGSGIQLPLSIALDANGNVFVADDVGGAIKEILALTPPSLSIAFGSATIPLNGTTSLTFTVTNPNPDADSAFSGVDFSDTLPAGLVLATPNGLSGACGAGTITAVAGSGAISLSGGSVDPAAACTFSVNVVGMAAGVKNNTTGAVASAEAGTGNTASASVTVIGAPTVSSIAPGTGPLSGGQTVTLSGTNFVPGATTVTIGGNPCTGVNVLSTTSLTCSVPAGAGVGAASVVATTASGSNAANALYTYAARVLPTTIATPTLPEWGKLVLVALMAVVAMAALRRRRAR